MFSESCAPEAVVGPVMTLVKAELGSGITCGSVPAREYEETLHKAAGMEMALEAYQNSSNVIPSLSRDL